MELWFAVLLSGLLLNHSPTSAESNISQQQVQFKKGESGVTLKGRIRGDQTVDYQVRAAAGQVMVLNFKPSNPSAYFNVIGPESDVALFVGSTLGNEFAAGLPHSGVYIVRVYLMRNAARRNEHATYTLELVISDEAKKPGAAVAPLSHNSGALK